MKDVVTRIITHCIDEDDSVVLRASVSVRPDLTGWDYCLEVHHGLCMINRYTGAMIDVVKGFAEWQGNTSRDLVGFDDEKSGQFITDPWTDRTGRFPLSNEGAFKHYGEDNVLGFVSKTISYLYDM